MSKENGETGLDCQATHGQAGHPTVTRAVRSAPDSRILVIRLSALGDFIMALPAMAAIRGRHPSAHITLLTTQPFVELGRRSGWFDRIEIDERPRWRDLAGLRRIRRLLREGRFDRVYDLQSQDRTALYFRLMWPGRRPEWSGIAPGASHRHTDPARRHMHAFDIHAAQLALTGIPAIGAPDLSWLDEDIKGLGLPSRFALLAPGSAPHRPAKRWPAARYGALAARLVDRGVTPVILGAADEQGLADTIRAVCPKARDLVGQTSLFTIAGLARGAQVAIGNDTGPMHLIALLGRPAVSLFSAESNPDRSAPRGPRVTVLRRNDLAALTVDEVDAALARALAREDHC